MSRPILELLLLRLAAVAAAANPEFACIVFSAPVLITDTGGKPDWMTGYADGGVRLDDGNLLWQTTPGRVGAEQHGAPVYRSTDGYTHRPLLCFSTAPHAMSCSVFSRPSKTDDVLELQEADLA
eukprot:SAG22_NODE_6_length_41368_cov_49.702222_26_plen_124_part_00